MAIPDTSPKFADKDLVDRTLDDILSTLENDGSLKVSDINRIKVAAQVQAGIDRYRAEAQEMSSKALREEEHNSARLGRHLEERFGPRPPRCHAHALVAGKHIYAAELRLIMAKLKIRIDDVDNGCWLPENSAATPHPAFPNAPPHSRIHRYNYFFWVNSRLSSIRDEKLYRTNLRLIARMLYTGKFPEYVMLKKEAAPQRREFA